MRLVEMSDRMKVEVCDRDGDDVVAADHAELREPCSGPISTSVRIPRIVRVIGAQLTAVSTAIAASRVRTQTGRRPAGAPRSAQMMSFRATTPVPYDPRVAVPIARPRDQAVVVGTRVVDQRQPRRGRSSGASLHGSSGRSRSVGHETRPHTGAQPRGPGVAQLGAAT